MIEVTNDTAALSTSRNVGAGRPANPAAAGSCPAPTGPAGDPSNGP